MRIAVNLSKNHVRDRHRRTRVLVFDAGALTDERVDFVRRMIVGSQALWRPRYVRALRTGATSGHTLDALAISDIHLVLTLLGGAPSRVSAVSPRIDDETGAADVAMLTLMFDGGSTARIDISLIEPEPPRGRDRLRRTHARARCPTHARRFRSRLARGAVRATVNGQKPSANIHRAKRRNVTRARQPFVAAVRAETPPPRTHARRSVGDVWEAARESIARVASWRTSAVPPPNRRAPHSS
jgi:hypothetical protein